MSAPRESPSEASTSGACPDCGTPVSVQGRAPAGPVFCARCGQRLALGPLELREIASELFATITSLELPIVRTMLDLLRGPGRVADAWIAGRRRTYVHPVKFVVLVGILVALTYEPLRAWRGQFIVSNEPLYEVGLARNSTQYFGLFSLVLLAPIALVLRGIAALLRVRRTWIEWYVLGLYAYGIGAGLQLAIEVLQVGLVLDTGLLAIVEFSIPPLFLAWGAFGFVGRGKRLRALIASVFAQAGLIVLIAFVQSVAQR